jgi:hypothetical protein
LVDVNDAIFPVPVTDANPIAGLELFQLYIVPGTLDPPNKILPVGAPLHRVISVMGLRNGVGFISTLNCIGVPEQVFDIGVTIIFAVIGTKKLLAAVKGLITPVPLPDNPILGFELVH